LYQWRQNTSLGSRSRGFDIPLPSRAINLPGVAANVVDIQDSKCEGRVNVTGEGSVSKRAVCGIHPVRRTSRSTKGRGKAPRIGPGIARVRAHANRTDNQKGCHTNVARMFYDGRAVVPDIRAAYKKKKRRISPLAANLLRL